MYAIILNFDIQEADCLDVSKKPNDISYEDYIESLGYSLSNCQWLITDTTNINFLNLN
jgi:hypothetical protein